MVKNNEIDLLKLCRNLWSGKLYIIFITIFLTLLGGIYASKIQQWWTSTAVITEKNMLLVSNLQEKLLKIENLVNKEEKESIKERVNGKRLLHNYISKLNSYNEKIAFLKNNKYALKYFNIDSYSSSEYIDKVLLEFTSALKVSFDNKSITYNILYKGKTAESSYELLNNYLEYVSESVNKDVLDNINSIVNLSIYGLENKNKIEIDIAKIKKQQEIDKTQYGLDIAIAAGVLKPLSNINQKQIFPIDLGSEALMEQKKILENLKDLNMFSKSIAINNIKIQLLKTSVINEKINFKPIYFLKKPTYPYEKNKQNKKLIVLVSMLVGVIVGSIIALNRVDIDY